MSKRLFLVRTSCVCTCINHIYLLPAGSTGLATNAASSRPAEGKPPTGGAQAFQGEGVWTQMMMNTAGSMPEPTARPDPLYTPG